MENISIKILFFGSLKDWFGNFLELEVSKGIKLSKLLNILKESRPGSETILDSCQFAVNLQIEDNGFSISSPCEIAVLPPFSGG